MPETGAQGWCTEMTLRDGMGREVGRGFRMGDTCTPMADLSQCMAKTLAESQWDLCKGIGWKKKILTLALFYIQSVQFSHSVVSDSL